MTLVKHRIIASKNGMSISGQPAAGIWPTPNLKRSELAVGCVVGR